MSMRVRVKGEIQTVASAYNWDALEAEHFLKPSEIVIDLCEELSKEDREYIKTIDSKDLILLHHTVGQYIRNTYGLWHPNNPLIVEGDLGDGHPDGISFTIIKEFHKYLNNKSDAYADAMSILNQEK
jgi:hypothetical protein